MIFFFLQLLSLKGREREGDEARHDKVGADVMYTVLLN